MKISNAQIAKDLKSIKKALCKIKFKELDNGLIVLAAVNDLDKIIEELK
jgi:hypothetical protein